jgi:sRNA-binding protein
MISKRQRQYGGSKTSVGDHLVACRAEGKSVSGKFSVVKNETLRLEARFDEQQLVDTTEAERAEAARKKKAEAAKLEEQKKALEAKKPDSKKAEIKKPEPKKAEAKNPKEAFRDLLNIIRSTRSPKCPNSASPARS